MSSAILLGSDKAKGNNFCPALFPLIPGGDCAAFKVVKWEIKAYHVKKLHHEV
jgi:hypothetical protein